MRNDDARDGGSAAKNGAAIGGTLRIVHCFRAAVGGVLRHVIDLVEAQASAGHAVGIICDSTTGGPLEEATLRRLEPHLALGARRIPMRRQVAPSDIAATWRLMREIRSLDPDVLHAHGAKGGVYARTIGTLLRAFGLRVARIYSPHGGSLHYDPKSLSGRAYFAAERLLERMTDAFIFVSQFEADAYAAKVGAPYKPATVVRNGLGPAEFTPIVPAPDARDFLFIGELRDLKGPDVFIEALALLRDRRGVPSSAVIVGSGPGKARYEGMVAELGLGNAIAFRDRMPAREAFALARAIVVPSRAESMPYVVLEAAAASMPMVATRVGGIPEIFGDGSDRLVPPGDAAVLHEAMTRLLESSDAARAAAASLRERVQTIFSIGAMADAIVGVYRSVAIPRE